MILQDADLAGTNRMRMRVIREEDDFRVTAQAAGLTDYPCSFHCAGGFNFGAPAASGAAAHPAASTPAFGFGASAPAASGV